MKVRIKALWIQVSSRGAASATSAAHELCSVLQQNQAVVLQHCTRSLRLVLSALCLAFLPLLPKAKGRPTHSLCKVFLPISATRGCTRIYAAFSPLQPAPCSVSACTHTPPVHEPTEAETVTDTWCPACCMADVESTDECHFPTNGLLV